MKSGNTIIRLRLYHRHPELEASLKFNKTSLVEISTSKILEIKFNYLDFTQSLSLVYIVGAIGGILEGFCDRYYFLPLKQSESKIGVFDLNPSAR